MFTIPSTPFREDGTLDVPGFRRVVEFCIDCGAHGLVFPVNASEWIHLSDDERFALTEVLVEQNGGRLPVIVGVTAATCELAARFAAHAREIGAAGVIAMPPHVRRRPLPESVIFDYYDTISKHGRIPVFVQNWYGPIGTEMSAQFLVRLCRDIEHVRYIKEETEPCTLKLTEVLERNDGSVHAVFGGAGGRFLLEEYRRGVAGNMPGCHMTDVIVALWDALECGDEDRAMYIYKELAPLFFFEMQVDGCYKEVLYRRGIIDCPQKRNAPTQIDAIASEYLDRILHALEPLMTAGGCARAARAR